MVYRVTIGSNIASLNAQRHLAESTEKLSNSFRRLSSGLRINKAKDDAAGLSVLSGLNVDRRVYGQGIRNLNDGISLTNVAEGAVTELSNVVIRIRELATEAANGTFSKAQRIALDEEAQALSQEYTRIAQSAEFNGRALFDGSFGELTVQAGYGINGSITSGLGGEKGDGTFTALAEYAVGAEPWALRVGDFNGDGNDDLVSGDKNGDTVSILLGNGDGTFQPSRTYATGGGPLKINVGDFNDDGIDDLVTTDVTDDTVSVLLGNGDGSFKTRTAYAVGNAPEGVGIGDFNGDGIQDLVAGDTDSTLSVLLGNGDGSFQARTVLSLAGNFHAINQVRDLNGDGVDDLVTTTFNDDVINVFLGNGDGTFQTRISYAVGIGCRSYWITHSNELLG